MPALLALLAATAFFGPTRAQAAPSENVAVNLPPSAGVQLARKLVLMK